MATWVLPDTYIVTCIPVCYVSVSLEHWDRNSSQSREEPDYRCKGLYCTNPHQETTFLMEPYNKVPDWHFDDC